MAAFCNHKWFKIYAFIRYITFFLQLFTIVGVLLWRIIDEVLYQEALNYLYLTGAAFVACVFIGVDYHWTSVVRFYGEHPVLKKKSISWLSSDSEPQFQFQNESDAPEHAL